MYHEKFRANDANTFRHQQATVQRLQKLAIQLLFHDAVFDQAADPACWNCLFEQMPLVQSMQHHADDVCLCNVVVMNDRDYSTSRRRAIATAGVWLPMQTFVTQTRCTAQF